MTGPNTTQDKLISALEPLIAPLGYEIVAVEIHTHRTKTLRLFIDRLQDPEKAIGIEDCVAVTKALDEPLEQLPEVEAVFHGAAYELEVSSPGVDRPLRQEKDYKRFKDQDARLHTFRPLTAEEIENADYQVKNPKQKNFLGTIRGFEAGKVLLDVSSVAGEPSKGPKKKGKAKKAEPESILGVAQNRDVMKNSAEGEHAGLLVRIPLPLISKANLEPKFDFDREADSELEGSQ